MGDNARNSASTTLAAEMLQRAIGGTAGTVAGVVVEPAVWIASGNGPDAGDMFGWAAGGVGTLMGEAAAGPAGAIVGLVKGLVDDGVDARVSVARAAEPMRYRAGIKPTSDFGFFANDNATQCAQIAREGGVAWQHANGAYCYIEDGRGRLVCDYQPASARLIWRPQLPLERVGRHFAMEQRHG